MITIFIDRLLEEKSPLIFGDGEQVRDFISVKDIAKANILAMKGTYSGEVFNVGSGKGTTVNHLADFLIGHLNSSVIKEYAEKKPGEPGDSIADILLAGVAAAGASQYGIEHGRVVCRMQQARKAMATQKAEDAQPALNEDTRDPADVVDINTPQEVTA